jgi:hypothetical protein
MENKNTINTETPHNRKQAQAAGSTRASAYTIVASQTFNYFASA